MKKNLVSGFLFLLCLTAYSNARSPEPEPSVNGNSVTQKSAMQRFEEFKNKAMQKFAAVKNLGAPRQVKKGNTPEIILEKGKIFFNGKELKFGQSVENWKEIISGTPRCLGKGMTLCIWDDFGLNVGTDHGSPQRVRFFNLQMSISEIDRNIGRANYPDGRSAGEPPDLMPHQVFRGYLELDGFGIDAETKFWEIQSGANPDRRLHCGMFDCSHPAGAFGENVHIYLVLDGRGEHDRLREFSLNAAD